MTGPSIILVGGEVTLDSGATVDDQLPVALHCAPLDRRAAEEKAAFDFV